MDIEDKLKNEPLYVSLEQLYNYFDFGRRSAGKAFALRFAIETRKPYFKSLINDQSTERQDVAKKMIVTALREYFSKLVSDLDNTTEEKQCDLFDNKIDEMESYLKESPPEYSLAKRVLEISHDNELYKKIVEGSKEYAAENPGYGNLRVEYNRMTKKLKELIYS